MNRSLNRGTGLLIIEVKRSNPNGDPDADNDPRTFDDGRGLISPVSFKRKIRDLIASSSDDLVDWPGGTLRADSPVRTEALSVLNLPTGSRKYDILEMRHRKRQQIEQLSREEFMNKYWDSRVFGCTFLEKRDDGEDSTTAAKSRRKGQAKEQHISTGVVQLGPGISVAPVDIYRPTLTNKAGVEEDKDRGMAPLAFRIVQHGLYTMPFFVNPSAAAKSGCDASDIDLLKFLIPHAYVHTASAIRPQVEIVHAWYAEHKTPLGSCPDPLIHAALMPRKKSDPERPSTSLSDYDIPRDLPDDLKARLASFEDLCAKEWSVRKAA